MSKEGKSESREAQPAPRAAGRRRGGHERAHGGSWKVAYADFVTAMLALFIVLWVLGQDDKVKEAVDAYFTDPIVYNKIRQMKGKGPVPASLTPQTTIPAVSTEVIDDKNQLLKEVEQMEKILRESEAVKEIMDQVAFTITDEGVMIEMRDASKFDFFAVGSAQMSPQLKTLIKLLTPEIIKMNCKIIITGHTDNRQYGTQNYTNWELSADRANSLRREMIFSGFPNAMIDEIRSYADTRLRNPDDPIAPENRRVSILLKQVDKNINPASLLDSLNQKILNQ